MLFHLEVYHKLDQSPYTIDFQTNDGYEAVINRNHASPIIDIAASKKSNFNQDKAVDVNHRFV